MSKNEVTQESIILTCLHCNSNYIDYFAGIRRKQHTAQYFSRILINTGAETVIPPIDGVAGNPLVYTSTSIMELTELPRRLVIIGGGYIGLEFASMYASFGSQVTVLESYPELIVREDRGSSVNSMIEVLV